VEQFLLAVYNCLFSILTVTLCIWRPSPPSANQEHVILKSERLQWTGCAIRMRETNYIDFCWEATWKISTWKTKRKMGR